MKDWSSYRPFIGVFLFVTLVASAMSAATSALSEEKQWCMSRNQLFSTAHQYAYGFAFQHEEMAVIIFIREDDEPNAVQFKYSPLTGEYCTIIDA